MGEWNYVSYRKKWEHPNLDPILKKLFAIMDERGIKYDEIEAEVGICHVTIGNWRKGKSSPSLFSLTCVLGYLGLELSVVDIT